ncbi:MAG: substrate-binding domain-containing protein [Acidimicrobiales bacterium]
MSGTLLRRVPVAAAALAVAFGALALLVGGGAAGATTYAEVNGQGSTYAALAFQTWTASVQKEGLNVNYTATGSPQGLTTYSQNTADFAGTEAEYSELYADTPNGTPNQKVPRGFAYTPDVAGAISIMYHVAVTAAGHDLVTYLHLSPPTIAKIFLGTIKNWDSPTISADNKGLVLPNEPITIDYRSGQSGTTALFYDFVKHQLPTRFKSWAENCGYNPTYRVWQITDCKGGNGFAQSISWSGSDQQAQSVASSGGLWSIAYDEFGYAKVYNDDVAWVENASGAWVQPYAENIAAALESAVLAPTTSQTLAGVYTSTNPLAYPISAYSYILYQCAPTPTRPTCKSPYTSTGVMNTMAKFMRYIACTGQINMATIGYSPLPTQLSQFLANAIGYMTGQAPATLGATNCANPQFKGGSLGVGAAPPTDPTKNVSSEAPPGQSGSSGSGGTGGAGSTSTGSGGTGAASGGSGSAATVHGTTTTAPAGLAGAGANGTVAAAVGGGSGSSTWLASDPTADVGPPPKGIPPWVLVVLIVVLAAPVAFLSFAGRRRRVAATGSGRAAGQGPHGDGHR